MNWKRAIVTAVVVSCVLGAGVSAGGELARLQQVDVEVTIEADKAQEGAYRCTAVVRDLASKAVVASPEMVFKAGESAEMRSGSSPGVDLHIVVSVNEEETEARYVASVYKGEELVSSQKVKVALGGRPVV